MGQPVKGLGFLLRKACVLHPLISNGGQYYNYGICLIDVNRFLKEVRTQETSVVRTGKAATIATKIMSTRSGISMSALFTGQAFIMSRSHPSSLISVIDVDMRS